MDGEITPDELDTALSEPDPPLVVDIRQPGAYRRGHIPGSVNLPLPDLARGVPDVADADRVVTVCPHGKASVKAARLIAAYEGFDGRVESLRGGLSAWDGPTKPGADGVPDETPDAPF